MTTPQRLRLSPFKAAILRALHATYGTPRKLTRIQRLRNWVRAIFGMPPREGDEPFEPTGWAARKPLPENTTGTVTFRRNLPSAFQSTANGDTP